MTEFGLFARFWTPGDVKTRLAAAVGAQAAARVYRASLEVTLTRFASMADCRVIAYTPAARHVEFESLAPQWRVWPQGGGDLGARMANYFLEAFGRGAQRVVLIGSDSPTLPVDYVEQAFACLRQSPVVLGPASDGGYYLVGMSQFVPALFEGIAWGTSSVWHQTLDRLNTLAMFYTALPVWHDFDNVADLQRLQLEITNLVRHQSEYLPLLAAIDDALTEFKS